MPVGVLHRIQRNLQWARVLVKSNGRQVPASLNMVMGLLCYAIQSPYLLHVPSCDSKKGEFKTCKTPKRFFVGWRSFREKSSSSELGQSLLRQKERGIGN